MAISEIIFLIHAFFKYLVYILIIVELELCKWIFFCVSLAVLLIFFSYKCIKTVLVHQHFMINGYIFIMSYFHEEK